MEVPLQDLLDELLTKIETMGQRQHHLEALLQESRTENLNLREDLRVAREEADRLRSDNEFLVVARRLADNPQALADTRRHIAGLIRRLDASIERLEDDPAL
ncbi:MAG: hypothetical protein NC186_07865 [Prevotella sp.]|nr:hypothetical protein [Prevotella sp.]